MSQCSRNSLGQRSQNHCVPFPVHSWTLSQSPTASHCSLRYESIISRAICHSIWHSIWHSPPVTFCCTRLIIRNRTHTSLFTSHPFASHLSCLSWKIGADVQAIIFWSIIYTIFKMVASPYVSHVFCWQVTDQVSYGTYCGDDLIGGRIRNSHYKTDETSPQTWLALEWGLNMAVVQESSDLIVRWR